MADFSKTNHRNLINRGVLFFPQQIDFFEVLKLNKRNINAFIRVAVEREIEREKKK